MLAEKMRQDFENLSFVGKLVFNKQVMDVTHGSDVSWGVADLFWNGYLAKIDKHRVMGGGDRHYVYLWKHAWGDPFYVGCGTGDRWTTKKPRTDKFYPHMDKADAVVFKVLDGVDEHTARMFEKYISVSLVEAGYRLANGDNNPEFMTMSARDRILDSLSEIEAHELTPRVQKALLDILIYDCKCDYRITHCFRKKYGENHFSSIFIL